MNFNTLGLILCSTEQPHFLGFLDLSTAPKLLFYSYIPIIFVSAFFGIYIYYKDKKSLQSKALLSVITFFILWVINILVQWVASYHTVLMFAWQLTALFEVGIFLSVIYFATTFFSKKDVPFWGKVIMTTLSFIVITLIPTTLNIASYNIKDCEGVVGPLWKVIYVFEPLTIIFLIGLSIYSYQKSKANESLRQQIVLFTFGAASFLTVFFFSNFFGEITKFYEFNLAGPIGMVAFLALLVYLIVKYRSFDFKLFTSQALVFSITILIGAEFFYIQVFANQILTGITLILTLILGRYLIRAVKHDAEARQKIENQEKELIVVNDHLTKALATQGELISLAHHRFLAPVAQLQTYLSPLAQGDFGKLPEDQKHIVDVSLDATKALALLIKNFANLSDMEQGKYPYSFARINLRDIISSAVSAIVIPPEHEVITVSFVPNTHIAYEVWGDEKALRRVFDIMLENAVRYTQKGSVVISLHRTDTSIDVVITDTGIGIPPELLPRLFKEMVFGYTASNKMNVAGNGIGLYMARYILDAHKVTIHVESEGIGKGSTFTLTFPVYDESAHKKEDTFVLVGA